MSDIPAVPRSGRIARLTTVLLGLSLAAAACTSTSVDEEREAHIYTEVVRWIVANDTPGLDQGAPVFLEPGDEIPVEVQAAVVRLLEEREVVRFIDFREEAVDETRDELPVRDDGMLVSLGPVPRGNDVEVEVERYRSADDRARYVFSLRRRDGVWSVIGVPSALQLDD